MSDLPEEVKLKISLFLVQNMRVANFEDFYKNYWSKEEVENRAALFDRYPELPEIFKKPPSKMGSELE